ncbi:glutelin type-A 2-like protein [Striga asiatica]|uniref:Glutelin type-A 2-like protein n=1 Tax=Striga asiatica TaxID=4170 RepID=A0A5A7QCW2_STRAF|nr:glutelin type-A 2-like protein [Striga asiatica]
MALNLSPQSADTSVYEGEGGGYYAWTPSNFPVLAQLAVGAGKLVLRPRGFALPHYADSYKIGYVVQGKIGTCTVGLVQPNDPQETIVKIKEGDAIPVPMGTISWWFNGGDSDTTMIFLGETKQSYNPGQFDYFFLTGALGALGAFPTEFTSKIYNLDQPQSKNLAKSQTAALILELGEEINMPDLSNCDDREYITNMLDLIRSDKSCCPKSVARADITADNFGLLEKIGLSASLVRLGPNSVLGPSYTTDGSTRVIYVLKGGGRVQIVGLNGSLALDDAVRQEHVLVVPKFFALALFAGEKGLEFYAVTTSSRPELGELVGIRSAWTALSSPVLQASLNVPPEFVEIFKSTNEEDKIGGRAAHESSSSRALESKLGSSSSLTELESSSSGSGTNSSSSSSPYFTLSSGLRAARDIWTIQIRPDHAICMLVLYGGSLGTSRKKRNSIPSSYELVRARGVRARSWLRTTKASCDIAFGGLQPTTNGKLDASCDATESSSSRLESLGFELPESSPKGYLLVLRRPILRYV